MNQTYSVPTLNNPSYASQTCSTEEWCNNNNTVAATRRTTSPITFYDNPLRRRLKDVFKVLDPDKTGYTTTLEFAKKLPWLQRKCPDLARHAKNLKLDFRATHDLEGFVDFVTSDRAT